VRITTLFPSTATCSVKWLDIGQKQGQRGISPSFAKKEAKQNWSIKYFLRGCEAIRIRNYDEFVNGMFISSW